MPVWAKAGFYGVLQWAGETCVGLIPLLAYFLMHQYGPQNEDVFQCKTHYDNGVVANCSHVLDNASQEICIIAVVTAGLSILSVCHIGLRPRAEPNTPLTYVLMVINLLALLTGMLLYGLYSAHIDRGADTATLWVLAVSVLGSFFQALEGAILDA